MEKSKINQRIMKYNYRFVFSLIFLLSFSYVAVAGGGWPQPKGKGYFKLSEWWFVADRHFTDSGLKDPNITTGLFNTSIYAEYGLTTRLTGIVYVPFFSRNYFNNQISGTTGELLKKGEAINALGDANIGLKYGLTKPGAAIAISTTLTLGLPLGNAAGGTEGALQTGDGEFNQLLQLNLGTSFGSAKSPMYAKLNGGFNNRTNDFSDEIRFGAEIGVNLFSNKCWLVGRFAAIESLKNGKTAAEVVSTSIFANNSEVMTLGLEANYYLTDAIGISAGFTAPIRGEITYTATAYSVGVFYDLK